MSAALRALPRAVFTRSRGIHVLTAIFAASCLLLPLVYSLSQSVPALVRQPFIEAEAEWRSEALPLVGMVQGAGTERRIVYRVKLVAPDVHAVGRHARIDLRVADFGSGAELDRAELAVAGTSCRYTTEADAKFPNNALLTFTRREGCLPLAGMPGTGLELTVMLRNIAKPALWTYRVPAGTAPDRAVLYVDRSATPEEASYAVRGRFVDVDTSTRARRADLLAYVWQMASGTGWIVAVVVFAGVLLCAGSIAFWCPERLSQHRPVEAVTRGAAAAGIAAALGLCYAVATPPFQAADEPNHFIAFASYAGRSDMVVEAARWARVTHFERIQFNADETFGPLDIGTLGPPWNDGGEPDAATRGGGIRLLWKPIAPALQHRPPPQMLLALRAINVILFATVIGCFVAAAVMLTDVNRPHLLAYPLFLLPTLPFFAMHVSNHALLLCAYIITALGVLVWFLDGKRAAAAGPLVGLGWAAAVLVSRSAVPLLPLVAAVLLGRLLLGGTAQRWRSAVVFWGGAAAATSLVLYLADSAYFEALSSIARSSGATAAAVTIDLFRAHPWLIMPGAAAAAVSEIALSVPRRRIGAAITIDARRLTSWIVAAAIAAVIVLLAASLFVAFPMLRPVDPAQPPTPGEYVSSTMLAALTMFRLTRPDLLTSWSFWGGFGWLDTLPDWRLVSALVLATAASFCGLMLWIRRRQDGPTAARLMFALGGFVVSIAAYALSVIMLTPADLHGRYLLGAYLSVLVLVWSPLAILHVGRLWIPATACMTVHGYCLLLILTRYF